MALRKLNEESSDIIGTPVDVSTCLIHVHDTLISQVISDLFMWGFEARVRLHLAQVQHLITVLSVIGKLKEPIHNNVFLLWIGSCLE
jgi:hypothetical protein